MDDQREREFLTRLWALQRDAGINDSDLARHLGVHASFVTHLKAERKEHIGFKVALAAISLFPELGSFLSSDLPTISGPLTQDRKTKAS